MPALARPQLAADIGGHMGVAPDTTVSETNGITTVTHHGWNVGASLCLVVVDHTADCGPLPITFTGYGNFPLAA